MHRHFKSNPKWDDFYPIFSNWNIFSECIKHNLVRHLVLRQGVIWAEGSVYWELCNKLNPNNPPSVRGICLKLECLPAKQQFYQNMRLLQSSNRGGRAEPTAAPAVTHNLHKTVTHQPQFPGETQATWKTTTSWVAPPDVEIMVSERLWFDVDQEGGHVQKDYR